MTYNKSTKLISPDKGYVLVRKLDGLIIPYPTYGGLTTIDGIEYNLTYEDFNEIPE